MLDIKLIAQDSEKIKKAMWDRNFTADIDALLESDANRRAIIAEVEALKANKNAVSQSIPAMLKEGKDIAPVKEGMKALSERIKALDEQLAKAERSIEDMLLSLPNIPHESVPVANDESGNVVIRSWGEPRSFDFEPKAHWDIGENLGILDFATAAKVAGARFVFYRGDGARLERALISYMLDAHTDAGYTEVLPPYMVNRASMTGTGQLPKFEEDAFRVANNDYFLIPTAEVPVTNMYARDILDAEVLPIRHCAYSACFRAEAGSAGRDTRGLIRLHQFNKVELVKFTKPEESYAELESLTEQAESVLQGLGLPYRVVALSTGDLGFASAKTYDIEVWMPSYGRYVEISSCSNYEDFQARRAGIRYRPAAKEKPRFVHTLNGSGVAVGRTVAAVLENYQRADGSVELPQALRQYMKKDSFVR
jgi:seryl-tRNA synthetase